MATKFKSRRSSNRTTSSRRSTSRVSRGRSSTKQRSGRSSGRSSTSTVRVVIEQVAASQPVIGSNGVMQTAANQSRKSVF